MPGESGGSRRWSYNDSIGQENEPATGAASPAGSEGRSSIGRPVSELGKAGTVEDHQVRSEICTQQTNLQPAMRQTEKAWNLRLDAEDTLGEWLGQMEWDYWGTWTFEKKRTARSIRRAIEAHIDRIGASRAFWCVEGGRRNGRLHLHGLLYFDSKSAANASGPPASAPTAAEISGDWTRRHGWADIDVYDGGRGAAYYVSERVGRDIVDYDLQGKRLDIQ